MQHFKFCTQPLNKWTWCTARRLHPGILTFSVAHTWRQLMDVADSQLFAVYIANYLLYSNYQCNLQRICTTKIMILQHYCTIVIWTTLWWRKPLMHTFPISPIISTTDNSLAVNTYTRRGLVQLVIIQSEKITLRKHSSDRIGYTLISW